MPSLRMVAIAEAFSVEFTPNSPCIVLATVSLYLTVGSADIIILHRHDYHHDYLHVWLPERPSTIRQYE